MSVVYISLLLILIVVATVVLLQVRALSRRLEERQTAPAEHRPRRGVDTPRGHRGTRGGPGAGDHRGPGVLGRAGGARRGGRPDVRGPVPERRRGMAAVLPRPTGPETAADNGTMDPGFGEALRSALEDIINEGGPEGGVHPGHPSQGGSPVPAEAALTPAPAARPT
ncbi:hypothetical protein ACFQ1I_27260 [Kitasatospora arboriphila]